MKLAIISPIAHLHELSTMGTIQFALGHIKDPAYIEFYRNRSTYCILDNGSYELGQSVSFEDILNSAAKIQPDEIVAPDIQWKPDESLNSARHFMKYLHMRGLRRKYKVMVVVWAYGPEDYSIWYEEYLKLKPDVIGVGKWLSTKFLARPDVVRKLKETHVWSDSVEHHFLGCAWPGEAALLANEGRSMDTSGPIADAIDGLRYVEGKKYIELVPKSLKRSLNFNVRLLPTRLSDAKENCRMMLKYAAGVYSDKV